MDIWSRKIVRYAVYDEESALLAGRLFEQAVRAEDVDASTLVLHSDNGGPMRGSTMTATLERLGVHASFSRPRVSDDNAFSESLFRTCKYRPDFPSKPFGNLEASRAWVDKFVRWYNEDHLHSGIKFVTPSERRNGTDIAKLQKRKAVYEDATRRNPERWSCDTRDWGHPKEVALNPPRAAQADNVTPFRGCARSRPSALAA